MPAPSDLVIAAPTQEDVTLFSFRWATVTDRGLFILDSNVEWEEYAEDFRTVQVMDNALRWAIGDMYRTGTLLFRTKDPSQALDFAGVSLKTVQNWAWICGRYPQIHQRVRGVSIHHHGVVAKLPDRRRQHWLKKALEDDLTVEQLQEATADERGSDAFFSTPYDELAEHYNRMLEIYQRLPDVPERMKLKRWLRMGQGLIEEIKSRLKTMKDAA